MKILLSILTAFIVFVTAFSASAQGQSQGLGLTVSPVVDEFTVEAGKSVTRNYQIINPSQQLATFYPVVMNFTTDNVDGKPVFYSNSDRYSKYSLSDWVKFDRPFARLAAGEVDSFTVTVTAPENAEPGGHYGALLFSTEEPKLNEAGSQVGVVGLIGTLLLATVPGEQKALLEIENFEVPSVVFASPVKMSLLFTNKGNVHQKPRGEIKIRNWSNKVVRTEKINEGGGNVLPESQRKFENSWQFDWRTFGYYTVNAVVTYGNPEQSVTSSRVIIVVPYWFIALAILAVIGAVYWLRKRRRKVVKTARAPKERPVIR